MSNSIWHKYDIKDMPSLTREILVQNGFHHNVCIIDREDWEQGFCEWIDRWAYLKDIIDQANKAERLQKAVDLAVHSFNEICAGVPSDIWVFDEATKATNEIKQLIKE